MFQEKLALLVGKNTDSIVKTMPVKAGTIKMSSRSLRAARGRKERRRGVIVSIGFACAFVGVAVAAVMTLDPVALMSRPSEPTEPTDTAPYAGTIVIEPVTQRRCRRMGFDNRTGRITEFSEQRHACEELAEQPMDENGMPRPVGTINRLNAIGKSFLKR